MIITKAPVRISFAGGGTDMDAFYLKHGGAVVSTTINKYFYSVFNLREDGKIQMISSDLQSTLTVDDFYNLKFGEGFDIPNAVMKHFDIQAGFDLFMASEVPPGSGLGSSGAVAVNMTQLCAAFLNKKIDKQQIAEQAYYVQKEILKMPIGKQDEYASSFGGFNLFEFSKDGVKVEPLSIKPAIKDRLEKGLFLVFTGQTRAAAVILSQQDAQAKAENPKVIESMTAIKANAYKMKELLVKGDLDQFGLLLNKGWSDKKKMNANISNEHLEKIYALALEHGALGGKLTGAGGSGYFLFYCAQGREKEFQNAMKHGGLRILDFKFDTKGVTTVIGGENHEQ
ncbi:MAG: GHMP kinase [Planctomycetes bacterium]|nr:GHMP kinase [Planctomycetota bacterium]